MQATVPPPSEHLCHAYGCDAPVPPRLFMCFRHWRLVPKALQRELWRAYRPGQEIDKQPSAEYLEVSRRAIVQVAAVEGMPIPASYRRYLTGSSTEPSSEVAKEEPVAATRRRGR